MSRHLIVLLVAAMAALQLRAQESPSSSGAAVDPQTVAYCDLAKDPAAYNHKLLRITGFVTYGFANFQVAALDCPPLPHKFSLWLMYGGRVESGAIYCCPGEGAAEARPEDLTVEGITIPLVENSTFKKFAELLRKEDDTTVRATLIGYFFSGTKVDAGTDSWWGGAGHLGCCSLLAIQQIESFEPHSRPDLDYTAEAGYYEKEGCDSHAIEHKRYLSISSGDDNRMIAIKEQQLAESGLRSWAFTDPQRVALDSLALFYSQKLFTRDEKLVLEKVRESNMRKVYRWNRGGKVIVLIVVTRPYWLSFYAKHDSIAWVSTMIMEVQCN